MDEIRITGTISESVKRIILGCAIALLCIAVILLLVNNGAYNSDSNIYMNSGHGITSPGYSEYLDECGWSICQYRDFWEFEYIYIAIVAFAMSVISALAYWMLCKTQIAITDKLVYGKTYFGRSVDLPMDSISAIGSSFPKGIAIATSSGKVSFLFIDNSTEIHNLVRQLLIERQENKESQTNTVVMPISNADELKKYKELLDSGVISQEEFDTKKKQLLGL